MTIHRASSPNYGSLAFPLLLLVFALAVGQDWPGARQLLQAGVDAWFGLWTWIGEHLGSALTDSLSTDSTSSPEH